MRVRTLTPRKTARSGWKRRGNVNRAGPRPLGARASSPPAAGTHPQRLVPRQLRRRGSPLGRPRPSPAASLRSSGRRGCSRSRTAPLLGHHPILSPSKKVQPACRGRERSEATPWGGREGGWSDEGASTMIGRQRSHEIPKVRNPGDTRCEPEGPSARKSHRFGRKRASCEGLDPLSRENWGGWPALPSFIAYSNSGAPMGLPRRQAPPSSRPTPPPAPPLARGRNRPEVDGCPGVHASERARLGRR